MRFMNLMFNVIPPPLKWSNDKVERKAYEVSNILKAGNINIVGIPEVIDETTRGTRTLTYQPKIDNRIFSVKIKEFFPKVNLLVYKVTPIISKDEFIHWLEETVYKYNINQCVFVGGESSKKKYPGINPIKAIEYGRKYNIKIAGITIFTRQNEPQRLLEKTIAGMEFFISQIVFELKNAHRVVEEYCNLCSKKGIQPRPIYISIAPLASLEDYKFIKWLGVEVPLETERYITEHSQEIESRTTRVLEGLINQLIEFNWKCGINIEHVLYNNLQLASYLVYRVNKILV